jgi:hypothetical protein
MTKRRRFGMKVKQKNLPKKSHVTRTWPKFSSGLTVKPDRMPELKFFETLEKYIANF